MKRADAIKELQTELSMRRKVWSNVKDRNTGRPFFALAGHQTRYEILSSLLDLVEGMTDKEFGDLATKVAGRKVIADASQPTLFS